MNKKHKKAEADIASILRVNQAGEYGAKRIYQGQLDALYGDPIVPIIQHMAEQEEEHLEVFNTLCVTRRARPTALSPLWHIMGYALGYVSGKLGVKAAMACTVAVEDVIAEHYQSQTLYLGKNYSNQEDSLKNYIVKFKEDELEHRNTGVQYEAHDLRGYKIFSGAVKAITRTAIELSKRL